MSLVMRIVQTRGPRSVLLIRLMVGAIFLSEGIQKYLYPAEVGAGRFARIGLPAPEALASFVATVEIIGGALILLGLLTRPAALVLFVNISVAILTTKIPILLGHGFWGLSLPKLARYGFWSMAHEARTDASMFLGALFLLIVGAGVWSLDAKLAGRRPAVGP